MWGNSIEKHGAWRSQERRTQVRPASANNTRKGGSKMATFRLLPGICDKVAATKWKAFFHRFSRIKTLTKEELNG
jgi:hypothetical protein